MRLGLVGLPQSGKTTIFAALTGARGDPQAQAAARGDTRIVTVTVADSRLRFLSDLVGPKKTIFAKIEYLLPSQIPVSSPEKAEAGVWSQVRICDGLLHVVRNFTAPGGPAPVPQEDFRRLEEKMVLNDLAVAEKRIERIDLDRKRGKLPEGEEPALLSACREVLEGGMPLRSRTDLASNPALRGFTFLSAKPVLLIINNDDEDEAPPAWDRPPEGVQSLVVRGRLEMDIASLSPEEAEEFIEMYHIQESALDRVIRSSYQTLNQISFFTYGGEEVRAWPIRAGSPALEAAGEVHSDMQKGFIRAEVLPFEELKTFGSFAEARKAGKMRLEGKDYPVQDGDIITFRFHV